jgi:hypothetical protein
VLEQGPSAFRSVRKWAAVAAAVLATSATLFVISLGSGGSNGHPTRIGAPIATSPATGGRLGPENAGTNRAGLGPDDGSRRDWDADD